MLFSPRLILLTALLLAALAPSAEAQYLYLDADRDGVWSSADRLNPDTTTVLVWLNTNHDRDGSLRTCNDHSGAASTTTAFNMFSFDLALQATNGGTVTWGTFTSPGFSQLGTEFTSPTAATYHRVLPFGTTVSGLQLLGYVKVTKVSGSPGLILTDTPGIDPLGWSGALTFGTDCDGSDFQNSYYHGSDWFDTDGLNAGSESGGQMTADVPGQVDLPVGQPSLLVGEFASPYPGDSVTIGINGLPSGLHAVPGEAFGQSRQMRLYGAIPDSVPSNSVYEITWTATDPSSAIIAHTTVKPKTPNPLSNAELEETVRACVTGAYDHGARHTAGRSLGVRALPVLARMLRDPQYRRDWHNVARAIGDIGDTSYFDTLRAFVRDRFHGPIDNATLQAIRSAQGSLAVIATTSARALDYLVASTAPSAWDDLPWTVRGWTSESLANALSRGSLIALAYTDSDRASDFIATVPMPADTTSMEGRTEAIFVRGLGRVSADVRAHGITAAWGRRDPRLHGEHQ